MRSMLLSMELHGITRISLRNTEMESLEHLLCAALRLPTGISI